MTTTPQTEEPIEPTQRTSGSWKVSLAIAALILAVAGGLTALTFMTEPTAKRSGATKKTAMLVDVVAVEKGTYRPSISVTGTVEPSKDVTLRSQVSGRVESLAPEFTPGGFVAKGDTLLRIESADYQNLVAQRESDLRQALSDLAVEKGLQRAARGDLGALAIRQLRGTNEMEVRVKLPENEREDLHFFDDFVVRTPNGTEVPLLDVAEVRVTQAFNSISRRDGRRVVTVSADVEPKNAMTRVMEALNAEDLPRLMTDFPGLTWSFEGRQAEMRESTQVLWGGFALAIGVMYALLAVAFRSYLYPLLILAVIPFGLIGAVIGHILLGHDLSLMSLMGIIALSGVVVNDSLIMLD